jgi:DNA-directed RNA polymerase beta subunit
MSERYTLYENGPTVSYEMTNPIIDSTELRKTIESNLNNIRDDGYERRRIWRRMLKRNEKKSDLSSKLLASVVNQIGNAQHLIKDYENWLGKRLIKQIAYRSMTKTVGNYTFKLTYDNMNIIPPTTETGEILYPAIARIRSLTYSVKVMIDVTLTRTSQQGGEETIAKIEGIMIADIPIMMGSKYDRVEKTIRDKIQEMKESERVLGYTGEVTPYSYIDRYKYAELVQNVMSSMGESPLDIPGYFIVEGASKIIKSRDNIKNNIFFIDTASIYIDSLAAVINCTTPLGTSPLKVYSKYRGLIVIYMQLSASKRYTNIFNLARSLMYGMGQSTQVRDENGEIVTITQQIDVSDMDNWFIQRIYQHCGANKDL